MSLKSCIAKAGKSVDPDDRNYMQSLIAKGRGGEEILNRLEQRITRERGELIEMLKDQGITVATAESIIPDSTLSARTEAQPEGRAEVLQDKGHSGIIESAVTKENTNVEALQATKSSATPSTEESASTLVLKTKAEPKDWSTPKNNTARRSDAGAYSTHRTFDKKADSGYTVVLNHKGDSRAQFKSLGIFKNEEEAKKAATAHWESVYVNDENVDLPADTKTRVRVFHPNRTEGEAKPIPVSPPGKDPKVEAPVEPAKVDKPAETSKKVDKSLSFDFLNSAVSTMLNKRLERESRKILKNLHGILLEKFPMYVDLAKKLSGIYDDSHALQQFVHTVTGEGTDKHKKADVLAQFAAINAQKTEMTNSNITTLEVLSRSLNEQEKADLHMFVSQMPLHDYFLMANEFDTAESIEAEAELLRKRLWKLNPRAVRDVEQLVDWNVGVLNTETGKLEQKLTGTIYNLAAKNYPREGEFGEDLRKLLALESIKRVGAKKFESMLRNEELMDVIRDNSVSNALATAQNEGSENIRDSLVMDYWKESFQIKAVLEKDFKMYEYGEETGWKVLQTPTRSKLGIVYKPTIDSTDIAGAYTDTKLNSTDVDITNSSMKKFPGVVETRNGYKLLLSNQQKEELGLIGGFSQGLVRSAAHSIAIQESQIIRNELLKKETHMVIGSSKSIDSLKSIIDSENIDNPWFIKLEDGTKYSKLSANIRAKYMPVGTRASNVKNFNENVDLVRKDISHWLLGGGTSSLFQNPQLKWAVRILKNLVSGAKIGMVVLNPIKIANDNLSNLTYLGVIGVSPTFIARNYKQIATDFAEYTNLQREIFQLKLQFVARPESLKIKKHLKNLQKRLAANSIGDIGDKGFINSLGSDLVSRSADTLSGFQADMHKSLEYLLTDKAGNKNYVSHFIMQMQQVGFQAESFFGYLGDLAGKAKSTKLLQQELDQVADRLREIKSEEDVVNYVSQFTTSPSSEAVRFGSAMTDLTDVLAKETLYRHFVQNKGMSPADARIEVLDSFPDYKENMPLAVKQLSDAGIIMFPSFWLRIQKIIYRMARDKPINLATELMVQEYVGSNINTIFEANVINKADTFGGLFHTPFEASGIGSVVPMHIWG